MDQPEVGSKSILVHKKNLPCKAHLRRGQEERRIMDKKKTSKTVVPGDIKNDGVKREGESEMLDGQWGAVSVVCSPSLST